MPVSSSNGSVLSPEYLHLIFVFIAKIIQLGALRKQSKDVEFVFIDGPIVLNPANLAQFSPEPSSMPPLQDQDPALLPRAWWKTNEERTKAVGIEQSLDVLGQVLRTSRYDGVLGFSQGAALAAVLTALLEKPSTYPPFIVNDEPLHPPFKFCVAVSGFRVRDPITDVLFSQPFMTRTLHVLGQTDVVVTAERAQTLLDVSGNKRVEMHEGGHFVPSKANWRKFLVDYMLNPIGDIPPPSGVASSDASPSASTATL